MQLIRPGDLPSADVPWLLTEDDLPSSDGVPMETPRHRQEMTLLIETLDRAWASRTDYFVGGDMFLYFSVEQIRGRDFRGPDFFVVLDVPKRERKSWVVWEEGKGPNLIVELLSESTATIDKVVKKQVYQDDLRVPEYVWYDPFSGELAGFALRDGAYEPIELDDTGRLYSRQLDLLLVRWHGIYQGTEATWLRWATADGRLLPTLAEDVVTERRQAEAERQAAEAERQAAVAERRRADDLERRVVELEARLARLESSGDRSG